MSKKVYIFLADGFEDIEGLTVVDLLRRAGIDIKTVSIKETKQIQTSHGITMLTDTTFAETDFADADMLVLPGGMPGTRHLGAYKPLTDMLCDWDTKGKQLAAICAAPSVFGDLGILNGKEAVCYPGFEERLTGATIGEGTVAVTDHVITSRGMGTAIDFAAALIARLQDEKKAEEIKTSIIYRQ